MTLGETLAASRENGRKLLSFYLTAGFPAVETTVPLAVELSRCGVDFVELGVPFSDPIADGPVIQSASEIALRNGMTLRKTLAMAREIRSRCPMPVVLMGYANPLYAYGLEAMVADSADAGVGGLIVPDLPLEESGHLRTLASRRGIDVILLAAPTTPDHRLAELDEASGGFLYCVSVTGVTGARADLASRAEEFIRRARRAVRRNRLVVGFGIAGSADARRVASMSDGIIIGSAMIRVLTEAGSTRAVAGAAAFASEIRSAVDGAV